MIKYKVSKLGRIKDYRILLGIISHYHIGNFKYDKKEGSIEFAASTKASQELSRRLKESGLVFKVME